jgi:hypothetical protein
VLPSFGNSGVKGLNNIKAATSDLQLLVSLKGFLSSTSRNFKKIGSNAINDNQVLMDSITT